MAATGLFASLKEVKQHIEDRTGTSVSIDDFRTAVRYSNRKAGYGSKKDASYAKLLIEDVIAEEATMNFINAVSSLFASGRKEVA